MGQFDHHEPVEVGEVIVFTSGEYSDYTLNTVCKVLKPFIVKDFVRNRGPEYGWYGEVVDLARLQSEGYVESMNCREIHMGSYF